jgi:hypothetical protein
VALGQVFSENFGFPLPIYIPSASPQSSSLSSEAGTIGQEWPQYQLPHKKNQGYYSHHQLQIVGKFYLRVFTQHITSEIRSYLQPQCEDAP